MFFAGISGSSVADVAVLSRTIAHDMAKEGYDPGFTAALIASASTMANLIPPSIMAVVYRAQGNGQICSLYLSRDVPRKLGGDVLLVHRHLFNPRRVLTHLALLPSVTGP